MVVIATKFDKLCPKISENVAHLFKSPKAKQAVDAIAGFHGVNKKQVLPVVNYTDEGEGLDAKDQLALKALNRIYQLIEGYLTHHPGKTLYTYLYILISWFITYIYSVCIYIYGCKRMLTMSLWFYS
jgi:hypothetical protein